MKDLLQHLNIKVIRPEGNNQLLCQCSWCDRQKLRVISYSGWEVEMSHKMFFEKCLL